MSRSRDVLKGPPYGGGSGEMPCTCGRARRRDISLKAPPGRRCQLNELDGMRGGTAEICDVTIMCGAPLPAQRPCRRGVSDRKEKKLRHRRPRQVRSKRILALDQLNRVDRVEAVWDRVTSALRRAAVGTSKDASSRQSVP